MSIISILIVLVVVGFLLWLVETYVPMPLAFKRLLEGVVVLLVVLWLLQALGLLSGNALRV